MKNRPPNVIYPFPQHRSEEAPVIPRDLAALQTQMYIARSLAAEHPSRGHPKRADRIPKHTFQ